MEKFEYEGLIYYFNKGAFYDDRFTAVEKSVADNLAECYFSDIDYKTLSVEKLLEYIKNVKSAGQVLYAKRACEYGLQKFAGNKAFVSTVLPMFISVLRQAGSSKEAVFEAEKYIDAWGTEVVSVPFYTSVAAAYCDLGDYVSAKKYADRAYFLQGGGKGYMVELSLVYRRINAETGGNIH